MKAILESKDFIKLVDATKRFAAMSDTKPIHTWIRLEFTKESNKVTAIAVDGYKMGFETRNCFDLDEDFVAYIRPNIKKPFVSQKYVAIELIGKRLLISYDSDIVGYQQPDGEFLDWKKTYEDIIGKDTTYKIGFNVDHLIAALQSAKASTPDRLRIPAVLEFGNPHEPLVIRTGDGNVKIALPVRLKQE